MNNLITQFKDWSIEDLKYRIEEDKKRISQALMMDDDLVAELEALEFVYEQKTRDND